MAIEWAPVAMLRGMPVVMHNTDPSPDVRAGDDTVEMPGVALIHPIDGGALLEYYTVDRDWFGDDWFATVEDAKEVAQEDWGSDLGEWLAVPAGIEDAAAYALEHRAAS